MFPHASVAVHTLVMISPHPLVVVDSSKVTIGFVSQSSVAVTVGTGGT